MFPNSIMNWSKISFSIAAGMLLVLSAARAQQRITIQIDKHSSAGNSTFDTTFVAPKSFDLDTWLEQTKLHHTTPGESVSTTVIISDEADQEASADIFRPQEESRERGMMGVYLDDSEYYTDGVLVKSIIGGGAADQAGLKAGDVITEMNGNVVNSYDDLVKAKRGLYAGDDMPLTYKRDEEQHAVVLTLTGRKPMKEEEVRTHSPKAFLGVYTEDLTASLARELDLEDLRGVYLKGVVEQSAADAAGLQQRDVIIIMNGREVQAAWELSEVLRELAPGDQLPITYIRNGAKKETTATLAERHSPSPRVEQRPRRILIEETRAFLGVTLQTDSDAPGVPVVSTAEGSAAEKAGLQNGDIIIKVDGKRTENYDSLASMMRQLSPDETVRIVFLRDERRRRTKATLGYRRTTTWMRLDGQQHLDPNHLIDEVRDRNRREGDQLVRWMESPNLRMEFFEFYPNPNSGVFTINFELERNVSQGDPLLRPPKSPRIKSGVYQYLDGPG